MYVKIIYVLVDLLALFSLVKTIGRSKKIKEEYGRWLRRTLISALFAITANIMIALSNNASFAEVSYCLYFVSIDWILYFLLGFCMSYTEHDRILGKLKIFAAAVMAIDSIFIFANFHENIHFTVFENRLPYGVFYCTEFGSAYYVHLMIDYLLVLIALFFIIFRIVKTYSIYRSKYIIILSVLVLVIVLNYLYMALGLVLDASVIFYAVAAIMIYFGIASFVPRSLKIVAMEMAIDDVNAGLMLFEIKGRCIYANEFSRSHFDIDPENFDLTCEPVRSFLDSFKKNGNTFGQISAKLDDTSGTKYYNIRHNQLLDKKSRPIGTYFLVEDVTENEHLLKELKAARTQADSANKAKSDFLASMSHEIRTPLNSVLGMNEMILRESHDPQIVEYATVIQQSGDVLLSLINDILDFSKIEANKVDIIESEYDPHKLLRECFGFFYKSAREKDLYIKIECDENIPSRLSGDERHIKQVVSNIISNAIKYTHKGGVTVKVFCTDRFKNNTSMVCEISDTGTGIAEDDVEHLFDAFRRLDEQKNANIQGTGLGLAITRDLVGLMHGTIDVKSKLGEGSTFTVTIPQKIIDDTPAGQYDEKAENHSHDYKESFTAKDAHILVVDDVKMNLRLIAALLKKTGIIIDTALGGNEAIKLCSGNKYDLILLDHRMPEPDGIKTFSIISEEGLNTDTPVIMLTANALSGAQEEYIGMGFADYLSKPVRSQDLEAALIRHLPEDKVIAGE